jgi:hypothetical protein
MYANGLMEETLRGTLLAIAGRDFAAMTGLNGLLRELHLDATASRISLLDVKGRVTDIVEHEVELLRATGLELAKVVVGGLKLNLCRILGDGHFLLAGREQEGSKEAA